MKETEMTKDEKFLSEALVGVIKQGDENSERHLKGYIYDSLMFRYMEARYAEAELERLTEEVKYRTSKDRARRDVMRFMEILNEAIGKHD